MEKPLIKSKSSEAMVTGSNESRSVNAEVDLKTQKEVENAVDVEDVWFHFGFRKKKVIVLQGINCKVARGTIYGLLGPSGCGKTTLLRCILGRVRPKKGSVLVFGYPPGKGDEVKIPGSGVGYMPQELAVFMELTINESFRYFGRIHGLSRTKCTERIKFLVDFLKLPPGKRIVRNLSGGQKRRVSFALALLTEAPLLILDEPTVGVDPLLRLNIWDHLLYLTGITDVTIIITTHYVEEARQAHRVGFMRFGRILAEDSPTKIMKELKSNNLEDVFITLCYKDKLEHTDPTSEATDQEKSVKKAEESKMYFQEPPETTSKTGESGCLARLKMNEMYSIPNFKRTRAVTIKNYIKMTRTWPFLLFQFILPSLELILFCMAIGGHMRNLPITVTNDDTGNYGQLFVDNLKGPFFNLIPVESVKIGIQYVKEGKAWGAFYIGREFTDDLVKRYTEVKKEARYTNIEAHLDLSNQQIAVFIQKIMMGVLIKFAQEVVKNITEATGAMTLPVQFVDPVYGTEMTTFTEFMAPGIIIVIAFFMALGLTSMSFVLEKKEGLLERTYVAGVTTWEILISHLVTEFGVMTIQVVLMLAIIFLVFQIPCLGPMGWVLVLCLLQGFCGMTYGVLISALCDQEMSAMVTSLATFYPSLLLSGVIWPAEAMPIPVFYMSNILPQRLPVESMRWIMGRGKGIDFYFVWIGFVVTIIWIVVFLILSAIVLKIRGH